MIEKDSNGSTTISKSNNKKIRNFVTRENHTYLEELTSPIALRVLINIIIKNEFIYYNDKIGITWPKNDDTWL